MRHEEEGGTKRDSVDTLKKTMFIGLNGLVQQLNHWVSCEGGFLIPIVE